MRKQYTLLVPFFDESESFTNGFECGKIWEKFEKGEELVNYLCHTDNEKQIREIGEFFGKRVSCHHLEEDNQTWMSVHTYDSLKDLGFTS